MTGVSHLKKTRVTENGDEPRCLPASSDDLHVYTVSRWLPTIARKTGPPAHPDSWSRLRLVVPHPPEQRPPRLRKNQVVSWLLTQKPTAGQSQTDYGGRCERGKLTCVLPARERTSHGSLI